MIPAHDIAPGRFVTAEINGVTVLCLKTERSGRDYTNHYLIVLDPAPEYGTLALIYLDPDHPLTVIDDRVFSFAEGKAGLPEIGDAFATLMGPHLKVQDEPKAQKVFAYVDMTTGLIRPRMERHAKTVLSWSIIPVNGSP